MSRTAARFGKAAVSVTAVAGLLLASAGPAAAATANNAVGAGTAEALVLTLNLPGGATTKVTLAIDAVHGTISKTTTTQAAADATVLRGSIGAQSLGSGTDSAMLPSPTESSTDPTAAIAGGLAGTPLANLLKVDLLPSAAKVTTAPSSASEASVANLGVGLPDAIASALAPLTGPLLSTANGALQALAAASGTPVASICAGATSAVTALNPVTSAVGGALGALPIPVPLAPLLNQTALGALCGLSDTIKKLNVALQDALKSLTGDSGVLGTGLITANQATSRAGSLVSSRAEASIAGLTILGQKPFANASVLRTISTASVNGTPGSAKATVDSTIADLTGGTIDPFLKVRTTIAGIKNSFVGGGVLPSELQTVFDDLFGLLNSALSPVGITLFKLDDSADAKAIGSCPSALTSVLTGTLKLANGRCAAAATRGVGLAVNLPAALAGPLSIGGPLVELQIVPTAAVVQAAPAPAAPKPVTIPKQLPRTGLDTGVAAFGLLLLVAGFAVRRQRASR